ncbi:ribonuclease H-like domain-containing protein [Tanacetum coccineum]
MSLHGYSDDGYDYDSDNDNVTRISKLDVSHPLHLHPNDSAALTVVSIKLKGTENYQVWSCAMLLALEGKNKTGFIDGTCRRSNTDEVLGRQWDRVNAIVLGWILNSISEELFLGQIFSKRAKHVWDELKETYDKIDGSVTFNLHHKINSLTQDGSSIADYYHKLNALWKQFDALVELPRCTCHAAEDFKKHNQLMKLMQFLMGLDDCYMQIRSNILSRDTLPDVRSAYAIISSEESHRVVSNHASGSNSGQRSQSSVFNSNVGNRNSNQRPQSSGNTTRPSNVTRPSTGNRRSGGGSQLVCENCGFNGHTIDRCFKIIGYPPDFGKKGGSGNNVTNGNNGQSFNRRFVNNNSVGSSSTSSSTPFSDEQIIKLISMIKENSSNICLRLGHPADQVLNVLNKDIVFEKTNDEILGDLVHLDLWGPYKMASREGFKYFLTIVDDFSRAVWVLLHQIFLGYSPQQNGIVERKHRHLLNVARSIMFQGGLPLNLWSECVLTATYLINRLPSYGKSPFELVFSRNPSLNHLRVFGCLCFATILNNSDKFSSRSEKCVLVGFPGLKRTDDNSAPTHENNQGLNHINFFNEFDMVSPGVSYDDSTNTSSQGDGSNRLHSDSSTLDHREDFGDLLGSNGSVNEDEMAATPDEQNSESEDIDVAVPSPFGAENIHQPLRRSERTTVLPVRYNDFVMTSKLKYGLEKFVGYAKLKPENFCFTTELNKSKEPKTFWEASSSQHWVDAMNKEMDALYETLFMHRPLRSHLKIALKVLRYLKGSPGKGVHIIRCPKVSLETFVDADWAKCLITRKSITGQAAIKIAANLVFHERTKHLEIDLHFVRDKVLSGVIKTQKISSADQVADIFTKGLDKMQHEFLVSKLGLVDCFQLLKVWIAGFSKSCKVEGLD